MIINYNLLSIWRQRLTDGLGWGSARGDHGHVRHRALLGCDERAVEKGRWGREKLAQISGLAAATQAASLAIASQSDLGDDIRVLVRDIADHAAGGEGDAKRVCDRCRELLVGDCWIDDGRANSWALADLWAEGALEIL